MKCLLIEVLTDPSFLGSTLGAIITGGIALAVYKAANIRDINNSNKVIKAYIREIKGNHENIMNNLSKFIEKGQQVSVEDLILADRNLNLKVATYKNIKFDGIISNQEKVLLISEYIVTLEAVTKLVSDDNHTYGNIFTKFHPNINLQIVKFIENLKIINEKL